MRALLLALTFTISTGCSTKTETKVSKTATATGSGSGDGSSYPGPGHEAQNKATEVEQARALNNVKAANAEEAAADDAAKAHAITHDKLQSNFDAADRRFNELKETASKLTGSEKQNADSAAAEVTKREVTTMASIAKLREATGAQWDATKAQVDSDLAALIQAINAFQTAAR
jgi:hypothetical protein